MKRFCYRFQKSILFFMMMLLYIGNYVVFFALLGLKNKQLLNLSRTSVVITFSWIIVTCLLTSIYGSYDVGIRKSRPIITSVTLTTLINDVSSYLLLNIMNRNDDNNKTFKIEFIGIFMCIVIIHIIWITLLTRAGNGFYFLVNEPEDTLVVLNDMSQEEFMRRIVGVFHKRYKITQVIEDTSPLVEEEISKSKTVFLYNLSMVRRMELIDLCFRKKKNVYFNPQIYDILIQTSMQSLFDDVTFLASRQNTMTFEQRIIKRLMDIGVSLFALIITSPIFVIAGIMIKANDGGPVFFRQKRATINGNTFTIYKFRTMKTDSGNRSVTQDDDRITSVGKVLRKYRLDELPQFINILKGEMSLVGPRPEMLENVEKYTSQMPEFRYRLRMKAGLTGYAQIVGKYNTTPADKLVLDLYYIETFSILRDISLLFQTVLVLLKADDSTEGFKK
ncbi:MAG: exopolysaccharide biosynthesis polyprenyl glycosylphosphotransferase [Lachnospiraceae bacterium]|nr:exopolysaccharide biosynthesis polyprenyl glycosylphosphotransferase [Lachnospiraceae bacterium]